MDCIVPGVASPLRLGRMAGGALSAYTVVGFSWKAVWVYLWGWNRGHNRGSWEGRTPHTRCCTRFHPPGLTEGLHKSVLGRGEGGCEADKKDQGIKRFPLHPTRFLALFGPKIKGPIRAQFRRGTSQCPGELKR